jgi:prepilin-type N-terminal cleavage/methylation domain-containing protein
MNSTPQSATNTYRARSCVTQSGVTFIEIIIVIAILVVLSAVIFPISANFIPRQHYRDTVNTVISSVQTTQTYALNGQYDHNWGLNIAGQVLTIYQGNSFATRDQSFDKNTQIPNSVSIDPVEVNFTRHTGTTSATTITITSIKSDVTTLSLNQYGVIEE